MTYEERNSKLQTIADAILKASLNKEAHYTRGEAVSAVAVFLYRLYDYYEVYGEEKISGEELANMLGNIC